MQGRRSSAQGVGMDVAEADRRPTGRQRHGSRRQTLDADHPAPPLAGRRRVKHALAALGTVVFRHVAAPVEPLPSQAEPLLADVHRAWRLPSTAAAVTDRPHLERIPGLLSQLLAEAVAQCLPGRRAGGDQSQRNGVELRGLGTEIAGSIGESVLTHPDHSRTYVLGVNEQFGNGGAQDWYGTCCKLPEAEVLRAVLASAIIVG